MSFYRKRVDENQLAIVKGLRSVGASVKVTSNIGGFVDIVVGYRQKNFLFEIKNPNQPKSKRVLTKDEKKFHEDWRGTVNIIETLTDALSVIGAVI